MAGAPISDAEWTALEALWKGAPATVREVLGRLEGGPGWAYSTVKTLLDRLVEKGVVAAEPAGLSKRYRPLVSRDEARRDAARALADKAFDGRIGSLVHFLLEEERLGPRERARLRAMLEDRRKESR
jgi:predicted transcriptional regulator